MRPCYGLSCWWPEARSSRPSELLQNQIRDNDPESLLVHRAVIALRSALGIGNRSNRLCRLPRQAIGDSPTLRLERAQYSGPAVRSTGDRAKELAQLAQPDERLG